MIILTNNYFKDHDTFKKYPELFITDEYISYIDSLNVKQRLKLLEEYQQNTLLFSDLTTRGYVDFNLHPEILYQECLIVYGSYLEFPENFYESRKKKLPYIHYRIKGQIDFKKKSFYKFMNGNAYSLKEKFGFDPYQNIQKTLDYIFKENEIAYTLLSKDIKYDSYIECSCNKIDCPYRTETCYKWKTKLSYIFTDYSKSKECGIYMKQEKLRISEKALQQRLNILFNNEIQLLKGFVEVQSKAWFICNRQFCENFYECNNKIWEASVNIVLHKDCLYPQGCKFFRKSEGERIIYYFLKENEINFKYQKRFINLKHKKPLSFDFYLPEYNLCIEYQGEQHTNLKGYVTWFHCTEEDFKESQLRDQIKKDYCLENEIFLLEIPYTLGAKEDIESYITYVLNNMKKGVFEYDLSNWGSSRGY